MVTQICLMKNVICPREHPFLQHLQGNIRTMAFFSPLSLAHKMFVCYGNRLMPNELGGKGKYAIHRRSVCVKRVLPLTFCSERMWSESFSCTFLTWQHRFKVVSKRFPGWIACQFTMDGLPLLLLCTFNLMEPKMSSQKNKHPMADWSSWDCYVDLKAGMKLYHIGRSRETLKWNNSL